MKYRIREQNELKASGVEWLGDIPNSWNRTNLVNFLKSNIVDGPHETPEYQDSGIPFISVDSLDDNEFVNLEVVKKFISENQYLNYNNKTKLTKNDLLFTKSATIGKVAIMDDRKFMTWSPIAIIKANSQKIFFKYLFYILKSDKYIEYIKSLSSFNTQLNIGMRVLEKSQISAPRNIIEQQKIANFLDEKSKIFDESISKKEQLISKLELAKQSLISEVVTGKLKIIENNSKLQTIKREKNELKPSGVEWLGDIPKDWKLVKLKYLAKIKTGSKDTENKEENGIYPFFVRSDNIERINSYSFDGEAILTAGDGVGVGRVFHYINGKFDYHQRVYKISNFNNLEGKFFYHYFKENFHKEILKLSAKSTVDSIRLPMLENFLIALPNIIEQKQISKYLDEKLIHFDNTIEKTKQSIKKLKLAKEALISQAVTGKIEVL